MAPRSQSCLPDRPHPGSAPSIKTRTVVRRLRNRMSAWRLLPKLPKQSETLPNSTAGPSSKTRSSDTQHGAGSASTLPDVGGMRPSISSHKLGFNSRRPDLECQAKTEHCNMLAENDPFLEENIFNTNLDSVLTLLPDGSSTPRRSRSLRRHSALLRAREATTKTNPKPFGAISAPKVPRRTSSRARPQLEMAPVTKEQVKYKKHPSPSKQVLQSLDEHYKELRLRPRPQPQFPKSATVQNLSRPYGLYEATTVSQERLSISSRKAKLVHLKGKSANSALPTARPQTANGLRGEDPEKEQQGVLLPPPPPPESLSFQRAADKTAGQLSSQENRTTQPRPKPLLLQPDDFLVDLTSPARPYYALAAVPPPHNNPARPLPISFSAPRLQPLDGLADKENQFSSRPLDTKKHPSPTKAEWDILGRQWREELDRLGPRSPWDETPCLTQPAMCRHPGPAVFSAR